MKNNQQIKKTYIELSKSILTKFPGRFKMNHFNQLCHTISCINKRSTICEPCLEEKMYRRLLFFGLIKKEKVCIFLMRFFDADEEHCYD